MGISNHDYQQMVARMNAKKAQPEQPSEHRPVDMEGSLHDDIIDECNRRGWVFFHGSMAHRTKRTEGEPDFIILGSVTETWIDGTGPSQVPRVWLIECKAKKRKRSTAQLEMAARAEANGHKIHVVRSMAEFLEKVT